MIFDIKNSFILGTFNSLKGKYLLIFLVICLLSIFEGLLLSASISGIIPLIDNLSNNEIKQNAVWPISLFLNLSSLNLNTILTIFSCLIISKVIVSLINLLMTIYLKIILWDKWQRNIIKKQLSIDYNLWKKENRGKIINDLSKEIRAASSYIFSFSTLINKSFLILILLFSMILVNFKVVLVFLFLILFINLLIKPFINFSVRLSKKSIKLSASYISLVSQMINSVRDIRLLKIEKYISKDIFYSNKSLLKNNAYLSTYQNSPKLIVELIVGAFFFILSIFVGFNSIDLSNVFDVGILAFFITCFIKLLSELSNLTSIYLKIARRYQQYLNILKAQQFDKKSLEIFFTSSKQKLQLETLEVKNLNFYYGNKSILEEISFVIKKGTVNYLYGSSGSGKTTLIELITRLQDPKRNTINLNGKDITEYAFQDYRNFIGYVPQEPMLFNGTFRENINIYKKDIPNKSINKILEICNLKDFIDLQEKGLETKITNNGNSLSGGQKCRLAIARALVMRPSLLILDETLGGVESTLEKKIINSLRKLKDLTILVISHRKENSNLADQILQIDQGKISSNIS